MWLTHKESKEKYLLQKISNIQKSFLKQQWDKPLKLPSQMKIDCRYCEKLSLTPFPEAFKGGVSIAVGSLNNHQSVIVVGALKGGGPHVKIVDPQGNVLNDFFAFDKSFRGGVNVGFFRSGNTQ